MISVVMIEKKKKKKVTEVIHHDFRICSSDYTPQKDAYLYFFLH